MAPNINGPSFRDHFAAFREMHEDRIVEVCQQYDGENYFKYGYLHSMDGLIYRSKFEVSLLFTAQNRIVEYTLTMFQDGIAPEGPVIADDDEGYDLFARRVLNVSAGVSTYQSHRYNPKENILHLQFANGVPGRTGTTKLLVIRMERGYGDDEDYWFEVEDTEHETDGEEEED
jgi:hypothetical protein